MIHSPHNSSAKPILESLLAPLPVPIFATEYWGERILHIERRQSLYYGDLFDPEKLSRALDQALRAEKAVDILLADTDPKVCKSLAEYHESLQAGKSIRINHAQDFSTSIAELCKNLFNEIGYNLNVNVYITPVGGRAIAKHYDTHDVFVLQVFGSKRWRLYASPAIYPLEELPRLRGESRRDMKHNRLPHLVTAPVNHELLSEFDLATGDLLYLPRGHWHEAQTQQRELSCHLTIGITPCTYADFMTVAIGKLATEQSLLRRNLPMGMGMDRLLQFNIDEELQKVVSLCSGRIDSQQTREFFATTIDRTHTRMMGGALPKERVRKPGVNIGLTDRLSARYGKSSRLRIAEDSVFFESGSRLLKLNQKFEEACRFVLIHPLFKPRDLPGSLNDDEKLFFAVQLVKMGLFQHLTFHPEAIKGTGAYWLPVLVNIQDGTISWADLEAKRLAEPFFDQSVNSLFRSKPGTTIRIGNFNDLQELQGVASPAGFIFHISRCGSTALSNALRTFPLAEVISEAQPINAVLAMQSKADVSINWDEMRRPDELLAGLIRAYGRHSGSSSKRLVIKLTSSNLESIALFRRLWPTVPYIIVIRDPLEVAVSALKRHPGWLGRFSEVLAKETADSRHRVPDIESFCAEFIGKLLDQAHRNLDKVGAVIDYADLNADTSVRVANFFGFRPTAEEIEAIAQSLKFYSKNHEKELFVSDSQEKQAQASANLIENIDKVARTSYKLLLDSSRRLRPAAQCQAG